jgi:hypothetical protein
MQTAKPDRQIEITINNAPYMEVQGKYNGLQIKKFAKPPIPDGDVLYRLEGKTRKEIANDETVEIHDKETFVSIPVKGDTSE